MSRWRKAAGTTALALLAGVLISAGTANTASTADSGQSGHTITYQAMPGQHPIVTGAEQVTGWQSYNQSNDIWVAHLGSGVKWESEEIS